MAAKKQLPGKRLKVNKSEKRYSNINKKNQGPAFEKYGQRVLLFVLQGVIVLVFWGQYHLPIRGQSPKI
jgi:hypothetical protein